MDDDSDDEGPDGTGEDTGAALLADEDEDRHFDIKKTKTRGVKVLSSRIAPGGSFSDRAPGTLCAISWMWR